MDVVSPHHVVEVQASARSFNLLPSVAIAFLNGMGIGSNLAYAGLVLPHHTKVFNTSQSIEEGSSNAIVDDGHLPLLPLSPSEASWFVSLTPVAVSLGILLSIPASEKLGRKRMYLLSNGLSFLGYLAIHLAPNFNVLLLSRLAQCGSMGFSMIITGVYLNEISTVKLRGPISGINMTSNVVGILFYTVLCIFLPIQWLSLALASHCLLVSLLSLLLPFSPQWLARQGREVEARTALARLRGSHYQGIQLEMDEIKQCIKKQETNAKASVKEALQTRSFLQPMTIFSVIFIFVGSCGNDTILYYGPTIFSQLSLGNLPPDQLAVLPWVGFTLGYGLSSPVMARWLCKDLVVFPFSPQDEQSGSVCELQLCNVGFSLLPQRPPRSLNRQQIFRPSSDWSSLHITHRLRGLWPGSGGGALHHDRRGVPSSVSHTGILPRPSSQNNNGVFDRQDDSVDLDRAWPPLPLSLPRSGLCPGGSLRLLLPSRDKRQNPHRVVLLV